MKVTIYIINFTIGVFILSGCFNPKDYDNVKPTGIIMITSHDSTVAADGSSAYTINASISDQAAPGKRTVVFKTSFGSFKGGTDSIAVPADDSYHCSAKLISLKAGSATITAKIAGVLAAREPKVIFTKAFPDNIIVSVDSFAIKNNFKSEALITATLGTNNGGKPTIGQPVNFSVTDNSGNQIGTFLNNISTGITDNNGQVKLRYAVGNTPYIGFLTIQATTVNATNQVIAAVTQIYLTQ